jgi:two-component system OmpR family sensor kinase
MARNISLVTRVARSAAVAASISALSAAVAASALGAFLLQKAEDRRLFEAARDLVFLLGDAPLSRDQIRAVVRHEHDETEHAGVRFTVSAADGAYIAGEPNGDLTPPDQCSTRRGDRLRICSVTSAAGLIVTAASLHTSQTFLFFVAALVALAFSGLVTWFWSRPMAKQAIAPFSRLRSRVAAVDVDVGGKADLGPAEYVIEVDELRATIGHLLERVGVALEQAQRFAANAAHELRTPLTAVRAELDLLAEAAAPAHDLAGDLAAARSKVADLIVLVEKLLVLATPKQIANEPNEVVSLRDVLEDVVRSLEPSQGRRVQMSDADALVRGDATLLASMFANALVNALKFGNEVRVELTLAERIVSVIIDDDGPGIPEADWERVFEPFYRDRSAQHRRQPGHGLGLALVRHIAESHGGGAFFRHPSRRGARLELLLPAMVDGVEADPDQCASSSGAPLVPTRFHSCR